MSATTKKIAIGDNVMVLDNIGTVISISVNGLIGVRLTNGQTVYTHMNWVGEAPK